MNLELDLKVVNSVDVVGKEPVNAIADSACFTYGWFKANELLKRTPYSNFYVTAYDAGKLVGLAPYYINTKGDFYWVGPYSFWYLKRFLNAGRRLRLWKNDFLLCFSPYSCRSKFSLEKNHNENRVINDIITKIDDVCKDENVLFSVFPFVSEFDRPLMVNLEKMGYRRLFHRDAFYLDIRWSNFEDFLKHFSRGTRKNHRREIRRCKENGITFEITNEFKELSVTFSKLYSNLFSKYQKNSKCSITPFFYETLYDFVKNDMQVFIARKNGIIVGFSIFLRRCNVLDGYLCGFNYDLIDKRDFLYFNVLYYEPIKWAIKNGIQKIFYRMKAEKAKRNRGCKVESLHTYVKSQQRIVDYPFEACLNIYHNRVQGYNYNI